MHDSRVNKHDEKEYRCPCCGWWLLPDEFRSLRSHCNICHKVKEMWKNLNQRIDEAVWNPRRRCYENKNVKMEPAEFFKWARTHVVLFLRRHPGEVPSIHRTGDHYEIRKLRVVSQPFNSSQRCLNCFTQEQADQIRKEWASGKYRFKNQLAREHFVSNQTIGRVLSGETYGWK